MGGRHVTLAGALAILGILAACGGGGGSSGDGSGGSSGQASSVSSAESSAAASSASAESSSTSAGASSSSISSSAASSSVSSVSSSQSSLQATIAALDATLPSEPSMPTSVCTTLSAQLTQSSFSSPSTVDPTIDNISAVGTLASASNPDTSRIQAALTACASGSAVKLVTSGSYNAFLTGPLTLPSGVTLWVDSGVTLYGSRYPSDYNNSTATSTNQCGNATSSTTGKACSALITVATGASGSGVVGEGTIDGRGGSALTGGAKAGIMTWWDVALLNKVSSYDQNCPNLLDLTQGGSNFTLYKIALLNSPHFHVKIDSYNGLTAWGVKLLTPSLAYANSGYTCSTYPSTSSAATTPGTCYTPEYTKNTDGIDPGGSNNVTIAYSYISVGDDNVAVTASNTNSCVSTAVNGYCPSTDTKIAHNYFYYGHGMSVGSGTEGGVSGLKVWDLSINGEGSGNGAGLRIKSYAGAGGTVSASYTKVCIENEKQPIWVDPYYSSSSSSSLIPSFGTISYDTIHVVSASGAAYKGGSVSMNGYSSSYPATFTLNNVYFDTAPTWSAPAKASNWTGTTDYANFTIGSQSTYNFSPPVSSGTGDTLTGTPNSFSGTLLDCSSAFPTFTSVTSRTDSPI